MVAFGVLLDSFLVRTVLVPALVMELDVRIWWPRPSRAAGTLATRHRDLTLDLRVSFSFTQALRA